MSNNLIVRNCRLSYANVFEPRSFNGSPEKYSASLLIPKGDKTTLNEIKAAIKQAAELGKEKFGPKWEARQLPLRDGDAENKGAEYAGMFFLNAKSSTAPGIVDRHARRIMDPTEVYSGCWANVSVQFYAYNRSGNQGIAVGLGNIQKVRDDESFDGRTRAEDEFTALDDNEAADGLDDLLG